MKTKYWVILFPIALYFNTLWNEYSWDDSYIVQDNKQIQQGISAIPEIFTSYYHQEKGDTFGYRPIVRSMYAMEWELFGDMPGMFHLFNVLYFSLLCLLIFLFLKKLFGDIHETIILFIVLVFAAHPVHTEVVASLKNREEIITMILGISALLLYIRYLETKKLILIPIAIVLIFAGVLTKENALTYPLVIPLIYFIKKPTETYHLKYFIAPVITFLIFFIPAWFAWIMPGMILDEASKDLFFFENPLHTDFSFPNRIFYAGVTLWFYFKILIIPYPLCFYYGYNMFPEDGLNMALGLLAIATAIFLFGYAVFKFKKNTKLSFFILFYLFSISVFANYYLPVNGIVGERLVFQASLGFCGALVLLLFGYFQKKKAIKGVATPKNFKNILIVILVIFSVMVIKRNSSWKSYESLLKADISKIEASAKGQVSYASWHMTDLMNRKAKGQTVSEKAVMEVIDHYKISTAIYPNYYSSYNNIGILFLNFLQRPDSALIYFKKANRINPKYQEALYNSGNCALALKQPDLAEEYFRKVVRINPSYSGAYLGLAEVEAGKNNFVKAFSLALEAGLKDTISDRPFIMAGNYCLLQKDTAGAVKQWEKAISKNPNNPNLLFGLHKYFSQIKNEEKSNYYVTLYHKYNVK